MSVDGDELVEQRRELAPARSAFCASLLARAGSSCTSRNTPSTPAPTPARASGFDVLGQAGGHAVAAARQLQAVRDVEHHRHPEAAHHRERPHVHDQVVVAERESPFGHEHAFVAGGADLLDGVTHVERRQKLALLQVDDLPGLRGRDDEVGLARQERGNLQDVRDFRRLRRLPGLMDVRQDRHPDLAAHPIERRKPGLDAQAAIGGRATCGWPCRRRP